ncbi:MAG: hypothetical protein KGJ88_09310 [Verrucomicrobiota bacterium]|nr:hypothetical protein [Verrucomicrobiota bacterium]
MSLRQTKRLKLFQNGPSNPTCFNPSVPLFLKIKSYYEISGLDPFGGSGTTGVAAKEEGRNAILIELNPEYSRFSKERIRHANQQNFQL